MVRIKRVSSVDGEPIQRDLPCVAPILKGSPFGRARTEAAARDASSARRDDVVAASESQVGASSLP